MKLHPKIFRKIFRACKPRGHDTGGPQIVQILGSQGIVLLRNPTKRGLVLSTFYVFLERVFF